MPETIQLYKIHMLAIEFVEEENMSGYFARRSDLIEYLRRNGYDGNQSAITNNIGYLTQENILSNVVYSIRKGASIGLVGENGEVVHKVNLSFRKKPGDRQAEHGYMLGASYLEGKFNLNF